MAVKNVAIKTKPDAIRHAQSDGGMGVYLKRIFALMFVYPQYIIYCCLGDWGCPFGPRHGRLVLNRQQARCCCSCTRLLWALLYRRCC